MKDGAKTASDAIDRLYCSARDNSSSALEYVIPYLRRMIRFIALPYYFFFGINWQQCKKPRIRVLLDLLYIFFRLKYYPYNYSLCRLWEIDRSLWKYYYGSIYEPYQRQRLHREVQRKEYAIIFDDKEVCYQLCSSLQIPLPKQYGCLDPGEDYRAKLSDLFKTNPNEKFIIKPVRGLGGKNIVLAYKEKNLIMVRVQDQQFHLNEFKLNSRSVIQGYLVQHQSLDKFSGGFNTVRVVTLLGRDNEVTVIGALMRFGLGDAYIDNTSSGGIAIGINLETGELYREAYDFDCNVYTSHPTSNITFADYVIPYWSEILQLAKTIQKCFGYYKLLGLDIGITSEGPVLIEINSSHDNIGLEQSYGPIFKNTKVREEYSKYDLIVTNALNCEIKGDL